MKRRPFLMGIWAAAAVAACGGGRGDQESPVKYVGTTLQLNGKTYEYGPIDLLYTNQLNLPAYVRESVIVQVVDGQTDAARELLAGYGLSVVEDFPQVRQMFIRVPAGFEPQWVLALRDIPSMFERAWLDTIVQLA